MIFIINIKNFGLRYYSDQVITQTSLVVMPVTFVTRLFIGLIVDKFGVRSVYRIITGLLIMTVLTFYLFMDNGWVFYLGVMSLYGLATCMCTVLTVSTSFIYDHEVGKRLQKYMHCAFAAAGVVTTLIHDNIVLQIFG